MSRREESPYVCFISLTCEQLSERSGFDALALVMFRFLARRRSISSIALRMESNRSAYMMTVPLRRSSPMVCTRLRTERRKPLCRHPKLRQDHFRRSNLSERLILPEHRIHRVAGRRAVRFASTSQYPNTVSPHTKFIVVLSQMLGHPFRQCRCETLSPFNACSNCVRRSST